jgi:hypothetical protein
MSLHDTRRTNFVLSELLIWLQYHPCTYCGKNHSPSVCQLINHPEANKKGEWVNLASYKKCKVLFLKDTSRLKSFSTLPMYKDTAGNANKAEATNKIV